MTRAQKVAGAVCLLACGLMAVASFMPWLSTAGSTWSGWDLVRHQRDTGASPFVVWSFLPADDGTTVSFFTGLVTLISAVWIAAWTALLLAVEARRGPEADPPRVLPVVALFAFVVGALGGLENAYFYYLADAADVSLKSGLVLLWGATVVAVAAALLTQRHGAVHHGSTAHPSPL